MNNSVDNMSSSLLQEQERQQQLVYAVRGQFFNELLEEWSRPPELIDDVMGQSEFFLTPDFASERKSDPNTIFIKDVPRGLLACSITPARSINPQKGVRLVYSLMQAGDWIRFGFLLQGDPKLVVDYQQHHEHLLSIERVWDRQCDYQYRDGGGLLVEWRFKEPSFYTNYIYRERFKILVRHLHFRLGRSVLSIFEDPSHEREEGGPLLHTASSSTLEFASTSGQNNTSSNAISSSLEQTGMTGGFAQFAEEVAEQSLGQHQHSQTDDDQRQNKGPVMLRTLQDLDQFEGFGSVDIWDNVSVDEANSHRSSQLRGRGVDDGSGD